MIEFEKATKLTDNKEKLSSIYHNLGNSLYKAEDYGNSVEAYKNALKNNPKDEETRFNLALAQKKLKAQQEQQQQDQKNDQNKEQNKDKKQQEQNKDKQEEQKQEQQEQQQQQQNKEEMSQEAAEQILEAFSQDEKQLQEEMQRRKGGQRSLEKDW